MNQTFPFGEQLVSGNARPHAGQERRRETRLPAQGRIGWSRGGDDQTATGLLSDESGRSLSFVTHADREVILGEELSLQLPGSVLRRCRVTRVADYGAGARLIAGRRVGRDTIIPEGAAG